MDIWNDDRQINEIEGFDVPAWIEQDITCYDIAAIVQGGCASGAYMPAVTYNRATETMAAHGDDVLKYIEDSFGELPAPRDGESWGGLAVHYLSCAVEIWASGVESELQND